MRNSVIYIWLVFLLGWLNQGGCNGLG